MVALCGRAIALAVLVSGTASVAAKGADRQANKDGPLYKVLQLIKDLEKTISLEGQKESEEYSKFACFCKESTAGRSSSIIGGKEEADILSASIAADTASKVSDSELLTSKKAEHEEHVADEAATKAQYEKDKAEYEYDEADLSKAIKSLEGAQTALQGAKSAAAVLLSLRESVRKGSELSRALDTKLPKAQALLQSKVDPNSPEYKYHSDGIISTLEELHTEFVQKKTDLDAEWTKTDNTYKEKKSYLETSIENIANEISGLETSISTLSKHIAASTEGLIAVEANLKDDKIYLRDLTERCEARAKDWDQRSQMRADELQAITEALSILESRVQDREASMSRALLQHGSAPHPVAPVTMPSFVQSASVRNHDHQAANNAANATGKLSEAQRNAVIDQLAQEASRLKSQPISMLAMKLAADPFAKVKDLIQALIERLLSESTSEATKEGFCNTELGKTKKDRDFRYKELKTLNREINDLELKKDELESEILELKDAIDTLKADLKTSTEDRQEQHDMNMETIKQAKYGLGNLTDAIVVLKTFYAKGAAAVSLAQASPVDEDTQGPGFSGSYGGNQVASKGIIGMLEVVKTDFQRTIKVTQTSEKEAQAEFVEFDRVSKTDISAKTEKKELDEEDLTTTKASLAEGMSSLQTEMDLLDTALKRLVYLKPMCTDFGMSYEDRVEKREAEIAALKRAICALGGECP